MNGGTSPPKAFHCSINKDALRASLLSAPGWQQHPHLQVDRIPFQRHDKRIGLTHRVPVVQYDLVRHHMVSRKEPTADRCSSHQLVPSWGRMNLLLETQMMAKNPPMIATSHRFLRLSMTGWPGLFTSASWQSEPLGEGRPKYIAASVSCGS